MDEPYFNREDRISRLQDELIHYILSFVDTKYAVQTSVLSKRWVDIWKSLPVLNFNRSSFSEGKQDSFIMFVDMVLFFRKDFDIQRFSVDWRNLAYDRSAIMNVNRWTSLGAVKYNVQEISILITQCPAYEIPHRLLNSKSLRKLVINVFSNPGYVDIILPSSMSLPKLTELTLHGLSISNVESSRRLFSSCPVLRNLSIGECNIQTSNQRKLIVDSPSLKNFEYADYYCCGHLLPQNDTVVNFIKLCASNVEFFSCKSFLTQDYSLEISSPLLVVYFHITLNAKEEDENAETYEKLPLKEKAVYAKRMMKFLGAVNMVQGLRLSPGFLEVLSQAPDLLDCQPPRLCNLLYLVLEMWPTRACLRAMAYLLMVSPNIARLVLTSKESKLAQVGDGWEAGLSLPGMLSHLKFVRIEEVEGCDAELKLLSFLLKNAKNLEEVVLEYRSNIDSPEGARQFQDKLRLVPTASSNIQMVFKT
ncbi:F-box/LRR-repeat protein At1g55660-like [Papaver somniferum]|nr:F-box/LRR-repeat protein At1g55660-like [Papaver somniferum]